MVLFLLKNFGDLVFLRDSYSLVCYNIIYAMRRQADKEVC